MIRGVRPLENPRIPATMRPQFGGVAHLVERVVRNDEVRGSEPLSPPKSHIFVEISCHCRRSFLRQRALRCGSDSQGAAMWELATA